MITNEKGQVYVGGIANPMNDPVNPPSHHTAPVKDDGPAARHAALCKEINALYARKNHDYGDSFHQTYEKWGAVMAAIRLEDKLQRFETLIRADNEVKDESIRDTLVDLANYAIMTVMELDGEEK